ncbi:MAG: hypothetical protein MI810_03255 [Flavobacteriales bacterium]|nr:hypothetical protein [Flavobacteriales bacterium]
MKNLSLRTTLLVAITVLFTTSYTQSGLLDKLAPKPPADGEAVVKMYSDAERTQEITNISDGMTKVYFRGYLWKSRTKRGDSPYQPMKPEFCIIMNEDTFAWNESFQGTKIIKVKGTLEGEKSMTAYAKKNDYLDFEIDLIEEDFLRKFVSRADENKVYPITIRLEGECKFTLANGNFGIDFSNGKPKYQEMLLAENDDIEIPVDLYPNDKALHDKVGKLIYSVYGISSYEKIYFYEDWELTSNGAERWIRALFTSRENGTCKVNYIRIWSQITLAGTWQEPYTINELTSFPVDCAKLD